MKIAFLGHYKRGYFENSLYESFPIISLTYYMVSAALVLSLWGKSDLLKNISFCTMQLHLYSPFECKNSKSNTFCSLILCQNQYKGANTQDNICRRFKSKPPLLEIMARRILAVKTKEHSFKQKS